jgi:FAD/FMN-containing dehydrogenase
MDVDVSFRIHMRKRYRVLLAISAILAVTIGLLFWRYAFPIFHRSNISQPTDPHLADDASRLDATEINQTWDIPSDRDAAEAALRDLLKRARVSGLRVSIAGARHSMGGQTIAPGGIRINMLPLKWMELDTGHDLLHVGAGARWAAVIPYLDRYGRSVEVMQSDNAFTVGGSLSVNCHGWQYGHPPIASTVESFRLMESDGRVVRCSRTENKELFSLVLGGYGLFGIILDADIHVVRNERLRLEQVLVPLDSALSSFEQKLREHGTPRMVYARLNIAPDRMFDDVLINVFYPEQGPIPELSDPTLLSLRRAIFRGSVGSDLGKKVRWEAETKISPRLSGTSFSRNQLMNESPDWYLDRSDKTTDILHEYFLPRNEAVPFLRQAKTIIGRHRADLLNVTVRDVKTDDDTFLRYATQPMIALVMFFSQKRNEEGNRDMEEMTEQLIDAAVQQGGRYYLPYRLHASPEQFTKAYPQSKRFFQLKRKYDPDALFVNEFYLKYGQAPGGSLPQ